MLSSMELPVTEGRSFHEEQLRMVRRLKFTTTSSCPEGDDSRNGDDVRVAGGCREDLRFGPQHLGHRMETGLPSRTQLNIAASERAALKQSWRLNRAPG